MNNILIKTANAAILGTTAKKAVIDVGAPSYTSGVHQMYMKVHQHL